MCPHPLPGTTIGVNETFPRFGFVQSCWLHRLCAVRAGVGDRREGQRSPDQPLRIRHQRVGGHRSDGVDAHPAGTLGRRRCHRLQLADQHQEQYGRQPVVFSELLRQPRLRSGPHREPGWRHGNAGDHLPDGLGRRHRRRLQLQRGEIRPAEIRESGRLRLRQWNPAKWRGGAQRSQRRLQPGDARVLAAVGAASHDQLRAGQCGRRAPVGYG